MKASAVLTKRESQIAELLAWGAAKKEVAYDLGLSTRTVETVARTIYIKLGIQKATELCVWWFCTHCGVSFDLSPVKRNIIAAALALLVLPEILAPGHDLYRAQRQGTRTETARRPGTRRDGDGGTYELEI